MFKHLFRKLSIAFLATVSIISCSEYDDTELWDEVNDIKDRVDNIEIQLSEINQSIKSLQSLINALQNNLYIVSMGQTNDGYEIVMSDGQRLTIHDGNDGANGNDGADGSNGNTPIIGVRMVDGVYYWTITINGETEFLTDDQGNMIPTSGKDGDGSGTYTTPIIKVDNDDYWIISYDGGATFTYITDDNGNKIKATGDSATSLFINVYQDGDYIVFVLANGTVIRIKSCSCDSSSELESNYISIDGASYIGRDMPSATTSEKLNGVDMSDQVMNGAMNYISVTTTQSISKFFIGIKGVTGYLDYTPDNPGTSQGYNSYVIPVMISPNYTGNSTMVISAQLTNGDITSSVESHLSYIETKTGAIEIKLSFSNSKDVDLHLYTPSNEHIYFGHRGGTYTTESGEDITYGLDVDSNAGCHIDNINKENIYIPAELVEDGIYRVVVNMYSNCDRTTSTNWSIVARYRGELITPLSGTNPATGVYPIGAKNGDYTQAMTFEIENRQSASGNKTSRKSSNYFSKFTPVVPTWTDMEKLNMNLDRFPR